MKRARKRGKKNDIITENENLYEEYTPYEEETVTENETANEDSTPDTESKEEASGNDSIMNADTERFKIVSPSNTDTDNNPTADSDSSNNENVENIDENSTDEGDTAENNDDGETPTNVESNEAYAATERILNKKKAEEEKQERKRLQKLEKKNKKKKKMSLKVKIPLIVIIAMLIIAGGLTLFLNHIFNQLHDDTILDNDILTVNPIQPVDLEKTGKINFLILGVDKDGTRTDTIAIASVDLTENKINMLNIPRDTRMYISGKYQKINAAHAMKGKDGKMKGPQGSIEAVTRLTGIPINYYVEFTFSAFRETIDALDGVYFNVPRNMKYDDPAQDLHISLVQGYQLLDGDKAEQLVRFRRYPEGDIKRVQVQQEFIKALAEQKLDSSLITKLPNLYTALVNNVKTNFGFDDMTSYMGNIAKLKFENLQTYTLPGTYSGSEYKASYWLCNISETKTLVQTYFGYDATYATTGKPIDNAVYGEPGDENTPIKIWESDKENTTDKSTTISDSTQSKGSTTTKKTGADTTKKTTATPTPKPAKSDSKTTDKTSSTTNKTNKTNKTTSTNKTSTNKTTSTSDNDSDSDKTTTNKKAPAVTKPGSTQSTSDSSSSKDKNTEQNTSQSGSKTSSDDNSSQSSSSSDSSSSSQSSGGYQRPAANVDSTEE